MAQSDDLDVLKLKLLKILDQDRQRAVQFYNSVKDQIDKQPQALLLIGDKATQTLHNIFNNSSNMIKLYQIQKKKVENKKGSKDIQDILKDIQNGQKK